MKKNKKTRINAGKGFLTRNYRKSWDFFRESGNYFVFVLIIFFAAFFAGFFIPVPESLQAYISGMIKEIAESFSGLTLQQTITSIFLNNINASFFAVSLGIFFGIFPFIMAVFNGYIVGFVSRLAVSQKGFVVLWRLLPHGIFELPAVIASISFGLKIGMSLFSSRKNELKRSLIESARFFVFIILPLIFVAAIIEGILVYFSG